MKVLRPSRLTAYLVAVEALAVVTVAWLIRGTLHGSGMRPSLVVLVFTLLIVAGEAKPIRLSRGGQDYDEVTISATFCLAAAMVGPVWILLGAQLFASALDDLRRRKDLQRVAFNMAQLSLTVFATRAAFSLVSGRDLLADSGRMGLRDILAGLAAGVVFFVVNNGLTGTVVAIALDRPLLAHLREDVRIQLSTSGVLLSFAPVVVVAAQSSLALVPLMLLPILAVHRSADLAMQREQQSLHDALTGLPNRLFLQDVALRELQEAERSGAQTAVLLLDLDHFKEINDTLGHHVGDQLLRAVAARLREVVRSQDTVARLGGDEFAVLATDLTGTAEALELANRLVAAIGSSFVLDGVRLDAQASIGIAVAPLHGTDPAALLQRADVALYAAKDHRGRAEVYRPETDSHSVEKLALLGELREGIAEGHLRVHYQPKCDSSTGRLVGLEALVRWEHPRRGLLYPDTFITIAENTGLIGPLTFEVLDQALGTARRLRDGGVALGVAVNLSVRLLTDLELPSQVASLLGRWGLPPDVLTLEVTETSIMVDPSRTMAVLGLLRDLGVTLSIDDFGTGYSSLSYLRRLEAHELKIDRSFVFGMTTNSDDAVIVRSTIELGHNLGLTLVAEGVEDADTWRMLQALGCDVIQGYHLARPMPPEALVAWIDAYRPPMKDPVLAKGSRGSTPAAAMAVPSEA